MIGISVIIPAYNAGSTIEESLNSVLQQNGLEYFNLQIIVVDDGSTDNTVEVCQKFIKQINLITIKNSGVSVARNRGVEEAKFEWLAFLDSDDIWHENKLVEHFRNIDNYNWSITDSFYFGINQTGTVKRSELTLIPPECSFENLFLENYITTSTLIVKKSVFQHYGGFDPDLPALEDWDLWLKIAKDHPLKYVSTPLTMYRVTAGSTSRKSRKMLTLHIKFLYKTYKKYGLSNNLYKESVSNSAIICSYIAEDSEDTLHTIYCSIIALLYKPTRIQNYKRLLSSLFLLFK